MKAPEEQTLLALVVKAYDNAVLEEHVFKGKSDPVCVKLQHIARGRKEAFQVVCHALNGVRGGLEQAAEDIPKEVD